MLHLNLVTLSLLRITSQSIITILLLPLSKFLYKIVNNMNLTVFHSLKVLSILVLSSGSLHHLNRLLFSLLIDHHPIDESVSVFRGEFPRGY